LRRGDGGTIKGEVKVRSRDELSLLSYTLSQRGDTCEGKQPELTSRPEKALRISMIVGEIATVFERNLVSSRYLLQMIEEAYRCRGSKVSIPTRYKVLRWVLRVVRRETQSLWNRPVSLR